jgi:superfamily II DNA or RNA helicase
MFGWFKGKLRTKTSERWFWRAFLPEGLVIVPNEGSLPATSKGRERIEVAGSEDLLSQLEDDGLTVSHGDAVVIPWEHVFRLLGGSDQQDCRSLLGLPEEVPCVPALQSHGTLTDRSFGISIPLWFDRDGKTLPKVQTCGGAVFDGKGWGLLSKEAWETVELVGRFEARPEAEREQIANRRHWGRIRLSAMAAGARLDQFLHKTVVLAPEKLHIGLRSSEVATTRVVEVEPGFEGAPKDWLRYFDSRPDIPDVYSIPSPDGIVQVVITPSVKAVLSSIKRFPGRRVAGTRAEAFLINPFAALGDAASEAIEEAQFQSARERAGLLFERFNAHIKFDALGYPEEIGLKIEAPGPDGSMESETRLFEDDPEAANFVVDVERALKADRQLFGWNGYDFEILGYAEHEIGLLREALQRRREPRILINQAAVYDLSAYSSRIEAIGVEKPYYSPFIAKKDEGEGWFPDNIIPVVSWTPEGEREPVAVPITREAKDAIKAKIEEARAKGEDAFVLSGFDKPMPIDEAEAILRTFEEVAKDALVGRLDPGKNSNRPEGRVRKQLIVKANIQSIDYDEARRDILLNVPTQVILPKGLREEIVLKSHQISGVAWLQHLFHSAPGYCRGAVLADDMGLGKTLQLLAFLATLFESDPALPPALVVAPVSLLENWEKEAAKFFLPGTLSIKTAYGDSLSALRIPQESIDQQLRADGLVRFLKPGWQGAAKVILTTYETLRDLEFSFAAEKWSVMICDEAQRIKNPSAMVTRAAKKQNVLFKIACTGTPVENTLADLWCLFDFVQPGLLGALNDFGRRYRRPIEAQTDEEKARVEELRGLIAPQILRRTKDLPEIKKELKDKILVHEEIRLSAYQRSLYSSAVEQFKRRNDPGFSSPLQSHLALLHYFRSVCTDPKRVGMNIFRPEPMKDYRARSPKLDWFLTTLEKIKANDDATGNKVIVFCEFREVQRMLRHYIQERFGFAPDIINGDTSTSAKSSASRQKRIDAFQAKAGFGVLILSPVAVGFGVNIQEANHVIHYTRTWNPAKEDQATDRAYRLGQTRDVYVYYPIVVAEDFTTFDVKLDRLLTAKRALAGDMLNGAGDVRPGDFNLADVAPIDGSDRLSDEVTMDHVVQMQWDYFECLIAVLWQKKGFRMVYRTPTHDDGVDVVAISGAEGVLLQCKTSGADDASLGWEAVKDVVTGEAAYRERHPGVEFQKACVTNQFFNSTAKKHAELNEVDLLEQPDIKLLLADMPIAMHEVEKLLATSWH